MDRGQARTPELAACIERTHFDLFIVRSLEVFNIIATERGAAPVIMPL